MATLTQALRVVVVAVALFMVFTVWRFNGQSQAPHIRQPAVNVDRPAPATRSNQVAQRGGEDGGADDGPGVGAVAVPAWPAVDADDGGAASMDSGGPGAASAAVGMTQPDTPASPTRRNPATPPKQPKLPPAAPTSSPPPPAAAAPATKQARTQPASAGEGGVPDLPDVPHWETPLSSLTTTQLEQRDAGLIMHEATGLVRRMLGTSNALAAAAKRCDCPKEPEHPATTGVLCPNGCSGHGKCDKECKCQAGWGGFGCWTKLTTAEQAGGLSLVSAPEPSSPACLAAVLDGWKRWGKTSSSSSSSQPQLLVVLPASDAAGKAAVQTQGGTVVEVADGLGLGARLAAGTAAVATPFMLVLGPDMTLSRYTNLEAVERYAANTDFVMVGGMVEQYHTKSKRWRLDHRCRQLHMHNYTMSETWGYQTSQRACMVCHAVSEVFVANVARFRAFGGWDTALDGEAAFVDLFIRARGFGRGTTGQPRHLVGHCLELQFLRLNECAVDPQGDAARPLFAPLARKFGLVEFARDHRFQPNLKVCGSPAALIGNTGHGDALATNPCLLDAMERFLLQVSTTLSRHNIQHAAAREVYEGALKYQSLVPWAKELALDAWLAREDFASLIDTVAASLLSSHNIALRADSLSEDGHSVVFVAHHKSGLSLRLSCTLISVDGDTVPLDPYPVAVTPMSQQEFNALPTDPVAIGADNLLRGKSAVHTPTMAMALGRGSIPVRQYGGAYIDAALGGNSWTLNAPSRFTDDALGGHVSAEAAVGYGSQACSAAGALSAGCLDDWGWRHDWLNWEKQHV